MTQSNDSGNFDFINVAIGTYRVKAEAAGFKTGITDEFTVTVSARQRVDITLTVGEMTQTVSVKDVTNQLITGTSDKLKFVGPSILSTESKEDWEMAWRRASVSF